MKIDHQLSDEARSKRRETRGRGEKTHSVRSLFIMRSVLVRLVILFPLRDVTVRQIPIHSLVQNLHQFPTQTTREKEGDETHAILATPTAMNTGYKLFFASVVVASPDPPVAPVSLVVAGFANRTEEVERGRPEAWIRRVVEGRDRKATRVKDIVREW